MMSGWEVFGWGLLGGALSELLGWFRLRDAASLPIYWKRPRYWILTGLMTAAGGLLALAYARSDFTLKPILAINIGASAPLLIQTFISQTPPAVPGDVN